MNVNLGKGFGPLDFDENGKMFSLFPENLPYVDDDFDGDSADFTVYVDAELVEAVCNAGLDFEDFLRSDEEERAQMLKAVGLNPDEFELDFDRDVRERLEEEGYYGVEYDSDFEEEDEEDEDDEYDFEEDDDDEEDEDDEDYEDEEEDDDFFDDPRYADGRFADDEEDEDYDEDDDDDDEYFGDDPKNGRGGGDPFFGNM